MPQTHAIAQALIEGMSSFEVIDCHEHLISEQERLAMSVDVFTLFRGYNAYTLNAAGLSQEIAFTTLYDPAVPLDERWALAREAWERSRHTSYARALLLCIQKFYGYDDLNDDTYGPISMAMQQANVPGLYQRVLGDACRIHTALNIPIGSPFVPAPEPFMAFIPMMPFYFEGIPSREAVLHPAFAPGATVETLDAYLQAMTAYLTAAKAAGAVGIKIASIAYGEPDRAEAERLFARLRDHNEVPPELNALRDYLADHTLACATELDLPVAVHAGYWGDFRKLHPLHLIPLLERFPDTRFDIFHLGYPWVRDTLMLAKGFPNAWINMCWTHVLSQKMATDALDEALDLLPTSKILGFGADYWRPVEKVYGHLVMARVDIARALAIRVADGRMTETQALDIAHRWLWDNPVELYKLAV
jgi:predicted TIM-barrel fold metal-dependent hydrolase